jgi:hypothetical protein
MDIETERLLHNEARIGGNLYREMVAKYVGSNGTAFYWPDADRWIAKDAASLTRGDSYRRGQYSDPWGFTPEGGTEELRYPAAYHGQSHYHSERRYHVLLPEAALEWPIYKAAAIAEHPW